MKRTLLFALLTLVATVSAASAAIITVDNKIPSAGDYSTLQTAHDAASGGDTIYALPSGVPYAAITVTKQLHIMGTGFDHPGADLKTTWMSGTILFNPGSDGSTLEGFGRKDLNEDYFITIDANNIAIKNNNLKGIVVNETRALNIHAIETDASMHQTQQ